MGLVVLQVVILRVDVFTVGVGVVGNAVELQQVVDSANLAQFLLVVGHEVVPLPARVYPGVDVGDRSWPLVRLVVLQAPVAEDLARRPPQRTISLRGRDVLVLARGGRQCRGRRPFLGLVHLGAVDGGRSWILALQLVLITRW